jgi:hypothetical protein
MSHPAISAMALNTSKADKMNKNVEILQTKIPQEFWQEMKNCELISPEYSFI